MLYSILLGTQVLEADVPFVRV